MAEENRQPQPEPEIIPPGEQGHPDVWVSESLRGSHRIYVKKLRPFEIVLWVVIIGAILTVVIALLLGFFLIAIPVMTALIAIAIVSALVRQRLRRQ